MCVSGLNSLSRSSAKGKAKSHGNSKLEPDNRKSLANIRVVQRNLVYVTNLSLDIAKEEVRIHFDLRDARLSPQEP